MPTLKDIALRVGVSISTVSRAISNDANRPVNEETKRKIREVAEEIGYEWDSPQARTAKDETNTSRRIGCIVPQTLTDNHPYFAPILSGFRRRLDTMGLSPVFIRASEEIGTVDRMRSLISDTGVEGVLAIGWYDKALFELLRKERVVILGVSLNNESMDVPIVDCDRVSAARAAVRHLILQGHTGIGFIGGPAFSNDLEGEERYIGYKFAMLEAGLVLNENWILNAKWNVDRSFSLMTDMLNSVPEDEWPTAMFCASDMMAIPAMRAALERKCRIPEDIAFVGMDNIEVAQYTSPPLSSVQVPKFEIGEIAAKTLIDYVDAAYTLPAKILLPYELIARESSACDRSARNK